MLVQRRIRVSPSANRSIDSSNAYALCYQQTQNHTIHGSHLAELQNKSDIDITQKDLLTLFVD
jgi:hypothetical protein